MGQGLLPAKGQRWKAVLAAVALCILVLVVGLCAGFAGGQRARPALAPADPSSAPVLVPGGGGSNLTVLVLPAPDSPAAKLLLADPNAPALLRELYTYHTDPVLITSRSTETFLQLLQERLPAAASSASAAAGLPPPEAPEAGAAAPPPTQPGTPQRLVGGAGRRLAAAAPPPRAAQPPRPARSNSSSTNSSVDLEPFIDVSQDVLSYLRHERSDSLLGLLRSFSSSGSLEFESADPDALRGEVQRLLTPASLSDWYAESVARRDAAEVLASSRAPAAGAPVQQKQGGRHRHLHRHLLAASGQAAGTDLTSQLLQQMQAGSAAAAPAPAAAPAAAAAPPMFQALPMPASSGADDNSAASDGAAAAPTAAGPQSDLEAALCTIQPFSGTGSLQGVTPAPLACPAPPAPTYYSGAGVRFRPVIIPVAFHCLSFMKLMPTYSFFSPRAAPSASFASTDVPQPGIGSTSQSAMPPNWHAKLAANNLITHVNQLFDGTGIQFSLLETRYDPERHTYLRMDSQEAWQGCTLPAGGGDGSSACLAAIAAKPEAATPAAPHAVRVFVAGSRAERIYCDVESERPDAPCRQLPRGSCVAPGPWSDAPSDTWREDAPAQNFVHLSWDAFNPETSNSARFGNAGAAVLAAQLARFLGAPGPASAAPGACGAQLPALAAWCAEFRAGKGPSAARLQAATSCPADAFRVLGADVPDTCAMTFAPAEVTAMQAGVARYRPKLMAACAAGSTAGG